MHEQFKQLSDELGVIDDYFQESFGAGWRELKGKPCKIKLAGDDDIVLDGVFLGVCQSRQLDHVDGLEVVVEVLGLDVFYRMHPSWLQFPS